MSNNTPPIYVDLDGTLVRSDLLMESLLDTARTRPLRLLRAPFWLLRGRAYLKQKLAENARVDVSSLPYHDEFVGWLREHSGKGHQLVLATAADARLAGEVAAHTGLFDATLASDGARNLKGERKAQAIEAHADGRDFWYAGNDRADLPVWRRAQAAIVVGAEGGVVTQARESAKVIAEWPGQPQSLRLWLTALRAYQWSKNLLVFVALLTAHRWSDPEAIHDAVLAFIAFCLCASSVYVLNDLMDLPSDRRHPRKRSRPFACGKLGIRDGLLIIPVLIAAALATASAVGPQFVAVTLAYLAATTAYSLRLKTYVLIDVMTLAGLYTMRVVAGAVAIGVVVSFWLLAFSVFIFLSLALIKRYSELLTLAALERKAASGRDYRVSDLAVIQAMGVASGFAAVLVFALFINSDAVTKAYEEPYFLWTLCGTLLYWISRMWLKSARGEMQDDPLLYAARDRASLTMLLVSLAAVLVAV